MNFRLRKFVAFVSIALTLSLFPSPQLVVASNDCQKAKGILSVVNNGDGTTSGTISQGGKLTGATHAVFSSPFTPTPDPNTFSFTDELSITTNKGVVNTHNIGIFDMSTGSFSAINRIDPNTSTGDFAGSTGVLYVTGKTTDGGATFDARIRGEICYAN